MPGNFRRNDENMSPNNNNADNNPFANYITIGNQNIQTGAYIDEQGNLRIGDYIIGNFNNVRPRPVFTERMNYVNDRLEEIDIDPIEDDRLGLVSDELLDLFERYTNYRRQFYLERRTHEQWNSLIEKDVQMYMRMIRDLYNNVFPERDEDGDESDIDYRWDDFLMDSVEDSIKQSIRRGGILVVSRWLIAQRREYGADENNRYDYPVRVNDARFIAAFEVDHFRRLLNRELEARQQTRETRSRD